jgi:tRNA-binding protein
MADFTPHPIKPAIDLSVLEQLDVRVGTILSVRDVSASTRLVQLTVDFGDHQRSIVAALKQERSDPSEIEGRQALFVLNLPPRDMMGVRSDGMLFDIGYADGVRPVLAVPERAVPNGVRAG